MREMEQYYRVLELEPGASLEEVNQAYKDLAFIWHPDRIPQDNQRLKEKAQKSYKQLMKLGKNYALSRRPSIRPLTIHRHLLSKNPKPEFINHRSLIQT